MRREIFVYGTLLRGGLHADLLEGAGEARLLGEARCRGVLYDFGDWPALVPGGRDWVAGELFRSRDPAATFARLDPFESDAGFERREIRVRWRLGEVEAWAWIWPGPTRGAAPVAGGSWKAHLRRRAAAAAAVSPRGPRRDPSSR